jgi:3',5'-cyclic AMP phosphodiesterase CpdA
MLIAQISDTHVLTEGRRLGDRFDTAQAFQRGVESLAAQPVQPDLILCSGDMGERATPEEYEILGAALRGFGCPVRMVPGNHDDRGPMRTVLPDMVGTEAEGHLCLLDETFPLAVIGLDTIVERKPHGVLDAERLDWLASALERVAGRPTVIFMHHPPITTGLWDMDGMGLLEGREALGDLVARHGAVEAILCGHMHRAIQGALAGVPVRVAPSLSHQIAYDTRQGERYRLVAEPPQYLMHHWTPGAALVTHAVHVATAE